MCQGYILQPGNVGSRSQSDHLDFTACKQIKIRSSHRVRKGKLHHRRAALLYRLVGDATEHDNPGTDGMLELIQAEEMGDQTQFLQIFLTAMTKKRPRLHHILE